VIYDITDLTHIHPVQELKFPPCEPGPGKVQDRPRPHQVVLDPTSRYILVPDLGADLVRVLEISPQQCESSGFLRELDALVLPKGSYPRHVALVSRPNNHGGDRTALYVLNQDANTLLNFQVEYPPDRGLKFLKQGEDINLLQRCDRVIPALEGVRTMASHLAISVSPCPLLLLLSLQERHRC
jgi:hypothetical protein